MAGCRRPHPRRLTDLTRPRRQVRTVHALTNLIDRVRICNQGAGSTRRKCIFGGIATGMGCPPTVVAAHPARERPTPHLEGRVSVSSDRFPGKRGITLRRWVPYGLFAVACALSVYAAFYVFSTAEARRRDQFVADVQETRNRIEVRLKRLPRRPVRRWALAWGWPSRSTSSSSMAEPSPRTAMDA